MIMFAIQVLFRQILFRPYSTPEVSTPSKIRVLESLWVDLHNLLLFVCPYVYLVYILYKVDPNLITQILVNL